MIPHEAALLWCFAFAFLGCFALAFAWDKSKIGRRFWMIWVTVWALPVLVPIYLTAWLGS